VLIAGGLSGIQDYVLDVASEGGGQARRLRARSFFVQALAEAALVRVLRAAPGMAVRLCAAGKFVLDGPALTSEALTRVEQERREAGAWLFRETAGGLRFSLALSDGNGTPVAAYQDLLARLQREKLRPWQADAAPDGRWDPARLVLPPLDSPCAVCKRAPAEHAETDPDGVLRKVCTRCREDYELGRALPLAKWLVLRPEGSHFHVAGLDLDIQDRATPAVANDALAIANLKAPGEVPSRLPDNCMNISRYLAAYIPRDAQGSPIEFEHLAEKASGDHLLGVLKADGDHMGVHFGKALENEGWDGIAKASQALDGFFAGRLEREMSATKSPWANLYTVFSGGDDLLLMGPWNVVLDFAGHVHGLFQQQFGSRGLTFSAGIAFIKPRRPIKAAVEQAEHLLHVAKDAGRDRVATLGQIWEWKAHGEVLKLGKRLVEWTTSGAIQRGWIHTLLELALLRLDTAQPAHERLRATSRLAYHVARNWPKPDDRNQNKALARRWSDDLVKDFDQLDQASSLATRYLPAVLRYAQMATRGSDQTKD